MQLSRTALTAAHSLFPTDPCLSACYNQVFARIAAFEAGFGILESLSGSFRRCALRALSSTGSPPGLRGARGGSQGLGLLEAAGKCTYWWLHNFSSSSSLLLMHAASANVLFAAVRSS